MKREPTVSVIIPTYNRREYLQEAIDSVLAQTYTGYEIIVVDDRSTDGTGEALEARYGDRIRYVWQENQGESVARNRGIEMARAERYSVEERFAVQPTRAGFGTMIESGTQESEKAYARR